jgi:thiosulfate/3-mercaptopyruvate sulfurtransferase
MHRVSGTMCNQPSVYSRRVRNGPRSIRGQIHAPMNEKTPALVDPAWLATRLDAVRVIEIAGIGQDDQNAYRAGHIPSAKCWNWKPLLWDARIRDFPSEEEFARRLSAEGIGDDTTVVIYGEPVQFGIYAWWVLRYCGHDRVCVLDGGRRRWIAECYPLVTEVPRSHSPAAHSRVARNEHLRAGREQVLAAIREPQQTVILDARSPPEYRGERVGAPGAPDVGAVRYGRIPGARPLEYLELLGADERFRSEAEMRALFEARGAHADSEIIAYCRMSHRATVLHFAMTQLLRYDKVRVYDGSWTEWGNIVGVPIER